MLTNGDRRYTTEQPNTQRAGSSPGHAEADGEWLVFPHLYIRKRQL